MFGMSNYKKLNTMKKEKKMLVRWLLTFGNFGKWKIKKKVKKKIKNN